MENIISQRDALDLVDNPAVTFIDGSWYLPSQSRNAIAEYAACRIPGAVFFDIDQIADPDTDLPHMLPHPEVFAHVAGEIGISSENLNIVYDGPGMFSAPRVWWTLKVMGAKNVKILESGFDGWKANGLPTEQGTPKGRAATVFTANYKAAKVANLASIEANLAKKAFEVIDARPRERFNGKAAEPRPGLRSGHIPGSKSAPASQFVRDGKLVDINTLERHFRKLHIDADTPVITTCGSGVTAAILALALTESGRENYKLYDGSWAQWGKPDGPAIETHGQG
ncbi:MAG: 3-mercaptopyruvate sulfurtransferase [Rhizobiaceae bacterium]|nr:3-mercaptopyruvate sulfurtransferase [Rhizobiaceae bacterium]